MKSIFEWFVLLLMVIGGVVLTVWAIINDWLPLGLIKAAALVLPILAICYIGLRLADELYHDQLARKR